MRALSIRLALAAAVLLILGTRGATAAADSDPKVEKAKQLAIQAADEKLTPEQIREKRVELNKALRDLSTEQREEFLKSPEVELQMELRMREMEKRIDEMVDKFLALSANERMKFLDKQIDDREKVLQKRESWLKEREARAKQDDPYGDSSNPDVKPSKPSRPRALSPAMAERAKKLAARITPEQQAKRQQYREAMNKRLKERGLQPLPDRSSLLPLVPRTTKPADKNQTPSRP